MRLTPGVSISGGQTVSRQTLFDLWANAQGAVVQPADLSPTTFPIIIGSNMTIGQPGLILYNQTEQLWQCFYDQIDDTGVSLWLAFGADRFDDAFLAAEPIPPGSLFRLYDAGTGRMVVRPSGYGADGGILGVNVTNTTIASGTWFAGCVEGFVKAWFPFRPLGAADPAKNLQGALAGKVVFPCGWAPGGLCRTSGTENNNEFVVGKACYRVDPATTVSNGNHLERILFFGSRYTTA